MGKEVTYIPFTSVADGAGPGVTEELMARPGGSCVNPQEGR